jgi:hypothetical protein
VGLPECIQTLPLDSSTFVRDHDDANNLDGRAFVGTIDFDAEITGSDPDYLTVVGADHIAVAMWAKNPTEGSATVTVTRGYSIGMTNTQITLGTATVTWSGAAIDSLMSTLNNTAMHLLVMDFQHEGGGTWRLRTSVDGAAFTNQGTGSGTQSLAAADSNPSLALDNPGQEDQWVDELVMWAGNDQFASEELANLHDLADTFGAPMNEYEENYGAPICWQATATVNGQPWSDSGSGSCPQIIRVPKGAKDVVITDDGKIVHPRVMEM